MSRVEGDVDENQSKFENEKLETNTMDRLEVDNLKKTPPEHDDNESVASQAQSVQKSIEYGLLPENENSGELALDVITVHSICLTSWSTEYVSGDRTSDQGPKRSTGWLSKLFPSSRVLRYRYNIDCADDTPLPDVWTTGGIEREAQKLVDAVLKNREDNPPRENPRPIVFVGHDVGGIIIKKALVLASLNPVKYKDILYYNSTLLFLACPHRSTPLDLKDSFARLLSLPPDTFIPRVAETIANLAFATQRINAEFLDTKAFLRAVMINISSHETKTYSGGTQISAPNPFWVFSCLADVPYEQARVWNTPHLRLIDVDNDSIAFAKVFSPQIGQHPFTIEPEPCDTPIHKVLLYQSPPMASWDLDEFTLLLDNSKHWIADHEDYQKWLDSSGLGILHLRCPEGFTRMLSHRFYRDIVKDPRESNLFHIFSRRDDRCNSLGSLFASLDCQLVGRHSEGCRYSSCSAVLASQQACTAQDLTQLFSSYRRAAHLKAAVYFICCLDECDETRYDLIEILREMSRGSEQPVRFVVTTTKGRNEHLESQLASFPTIDVDECMKRPEERAKFTKGMQDRVDGQTRRLMRVRPVFLQYKDRFDELLASCLPDRQLACFVMRWLSSSSLVCNSRSSVQKILDRLTPLTTKKFIKVVLESFGDRSAKLRKMICWIKFAFEPPTYWEIVEALYVATKDTDVEGLADIDYDELRDDIVQFGGLITFDGHEVDLFRPGSFPSYEAADAHAEMASICLDYLLLPEVWETLEDMIGKNALLDETPVSRPRHNLASYAAKYWAKHYRLAGEHRPKAQALRLFAHSKARNLWAQAVYVWSNPLSRISKGYISALPVVSATGLAELVAHQLEAERLSPGFNADNFSVDVGLSVVEAACYAHEEVVQMLLKASIPTQSLLSEALLKAAASGDEKILNRLVGVAAKAEEFEWPLGLFRRVAWLGLMETAKLLLASNVPLPPSEFDSLQTSLVHMALEGNHSEMAKLLIGTKADLEATANFGQKPLHFAAYHGDVDVIRLLLATGADKNALDFSGTTPLQMAVRGANPQATKVLLEAGADANIGHDRSSYGKVVRTWSAKPLIYAAISGYSECVRVLLEHGANVNADLDGKNALWFAASKGEIEICRQLLKYGANANGNTKHSEPLLIAAMDFSIPAGKIMELWELLIEYKVNLEVQDESQTWRNNVLSRAVGTLDKDLVKFLLRHEVPINMGAKTSQTPLYVAAHEGNAEIVRLLLNHKADPNLKSEWNWTPLHAAYDNAEITQLLLEAGADINEVCDSGTVTYLAAKHNQKDVLRLLLGHTTKPNLETQAIALPYDGRSGDTRPELEEEGMTALCIACQKASVESIELLLNAGANVNHQTNDGGFPLKFCLNSTSQNTLSTAASIELLLKYQSKPNLMLADKSGNMILHNINTNTTGTTVSLLCRAGAEFDAKNPQGETPLLKAVLCGNMAAFKALRWEGADVKVCSSTRGTLLHAAANNGGWDIFQEVQAAGCDVGVARSLGFKETLLYSLASNNSHGPDRLQIAEYLIEEAKEDLDEESPGTAFGFPILAGLFSSAKAVTDYLIEKGAKLDVRDVMGRTPLHVAVIEDPDDGTIEKLLTKGADVMAVTKVGLLPAHFAAAYPWSAKPLLQLLKHIEDPQVHLNDTNQGGDSTQSTDQRSNGGDETRTIRSRQLELSAQTVAGDRQRISDKKMTDGKLPFDIEVKDNDGWTPLMWSAKGNFSNFDGPKALLERGASLWTVAKGPGQQWSPLKISRYYGASDGMIELLTPKEKTRTLPDGTTEEWRDEDHKERVGDWKSNWYCDHCLMGILGMRYRCLECEADHFDLCYKCIGSKDVLHPNHNFEAVGPEYEVGVGESEEQKPDNAQKNQEDDPGEEDDIDEEASDLGDDNDTDTDSDDV